MPAAARLAALAVGVSALGTAACGGDGGRTTTVRPPPQQGAGPLRPPASAASTRGIRRWSDTLRRGDVRGAARYFAIPAIVQIQPGERLTRITERGEAVAFNLVLPCGARLLRAERSGRYVNALFRLTERPGATCDAPGRTARTDFLIRGGKIAEWRRAPDEPGDADEDRGAAPSV